MSFLLNASGQQILPGGSGGGGGLTEVAHDGTLTGDGTPGDPLGLNTTYTDGRYLKLDGTNSPSAAMNWGGFRLENLADPNSADDALNLGFADGRYVTPTSGNTAYVRRDGTTTLTAAWNVGAQQIRNVAGLRIGSNTPIAGTIALANTISLVGRNATDTADIELIGADNSNGVLIGGSGGAVVTITGTTSRNGSNLTIGVLEGEGVGYRRGSGFAFADYGVYTPTTHYWGLLDGSDTPGSFLHRGTNALAGSGASNIAGGSLTIRGGAGKGSAAATSVELGGSIPGASGTAAQTTATVVRATGSEFTILGDRFQLRSRTTTQRDAIAAPAGGLLLFNDTTDSLDYYDGAAWQTLSPLVVGTSTGTTAYYGATNITGASEAVAGAGVLSSGKSFHLVTLAASVTVSLPTAAAIGDTHVVVDAGNNWATFNLVVDVQGGGTIKNGDDGTTASVTLTANGQWRTFLKTGATAWILAQ